MEGNDWLTRYKNKIRQDLTLLDVEMFSNALTSEIKKGQKEKNMSDQTTDLPEEFYRDLPAKVKAAGVDFEDQEALTAFIEEEKYQTMQREKRGDWLTEGKAPPTGQVKAQAYFTPDFLASCGVEPSPELYQALQTELNEALDFTRERVKKQRTQDEQAALTVEYADAVRECRRKNGDLARLRGEFRARGLGEEAQVSVNDPEAWRPIHDNAAKLVERAVQRVAGDVEASQQGKLREAYQAELAKIPRGNWIAIVNLKAKYRELGWSDGPTEPPARQRPRLSESKKAELLAQYKSEVMAVRGQLFQVGKVQERYRSLGLDI